MRATALVLNVAWLAVVAWLVVSDEIAGPGEDGFQFALLIVLTPIVSIAALLLPQGTESLPSLYFRRRAAEERQRINEIENAGKPKP